jgi:hypothetical protein
MDNAKFTLTGGRLELAGVSDQRLFSARYVRSGPVRAAGNQPSTLIVAASALMEAASKGLFDGRAVFIDHAGIFANQSLRNLVAVSGRSYWDATEGAVNGELAFYNTPDAKVIADLLLQLLGQENPPDVGLSLVFWANRKVDPDGAVTITAIQHIESIDLVFEPAADGRILQALSALKQPPLAPAPSLQPPHPSPLSFAAGEGPAARVTSAEQGEIPIIGCVSDAPNQGGSKMSIQDNLVEINKAS